MSETAAPAARVLDPHSSPRNRTVAAVLAFFVGVLGIHRFYVGKIGTGVAMLLTFGGLGFWTLYDFVIILLGKFEDKEGRALANW
ncbi:TM2 domain-containing protein [Cellulomonas timonensis]|uniref:TM2 domain-containing protein n=1 Tax=Cellulomonas timonensis TaxID=1689271 RepID=UPI0008368387|nr:TM2 domain-containing protein [Cellulomonas timonensis]